ncbi:MAG: hypothetical protein EBS22_04760, partial [Acidimicrobiia bacterium]|nr:hypothetical protein [Acidimicrobiia bacterium]
MTIDNTRDLPFYTEDCLPPCDPGSDGGPTYQYDENGVPVAPEDDKEYDDTKDQAVTVEPGDEAPKLTQIVEELVNATTAVGDDCNPEGCVGPDATPELGHLFLDSNGIVWRYVGDSRWQAEDGAYVYSVLDIPGYVDACLPPDVPLERECPEEYEGARYTDSNGIEWSWVGTSPDPAASDHGQHWFHRYEDGSTEYRYTVELEDFFKDCPAPPDLEIQTTDIFLSLRGPKEICVGESAIIVLTARASDGATINSTSVEADGNPIIGIQSNEEVWTYGWTPGQPGVYDVKGGASDTSGATESDLIVIVVIDCGDNTDQSTPLPINVAFNAQTQVCVGDKFVFQVIVTIDPSASLASLDVTRDGAAQSVGQQNPTTWSGSFLADAEGEVELVATGTDSNGTSDTARHYIKVISCDDTVPGSTPDDSTPDDSKPETKNSAPVVDVRAPECVEAESDGAIKVTVTINVTDADRDSMAVVLSGGSGSRTIPTGRYTINGSGSQSITFLVDYQDRGAVFTFTGTADDGQATGSDTATIRVDYPGGCDQTTDSSTPAKNSAPTVTISTNPSGKVQVCKSGQNTSVPVTITVTTADVDGDRLAILLGKDGGAL